MIRIIAKIKVKSEHLESVKTELIKLTQKAKENEGSITYELLQDKKNPLYFLFYENWLNEKFLDNHLNSSYMSEYITKTKGKVAEFSFHKLEKL